MPPVDPRAWFPQFYDNPAIRALRNACRWTISGQVGELDAGRDNNAGPGATTSTGTAKRPTRKAPIDLRELINNGRVRGAWKIGADCLVTLDELTAAIPTASNVAFYLQAQIDGLVVIDIEPACPPEVARGLLQLPGVLYSELSMSGRGFHLITAIPGNLHDFPIAAGKRVLREEHGWYEILLNHWATFTRHPIPDHTLRDATLAKPNFTSIEALYAELATKARASTNSSSTAVSTDARPSDIPHAETVIRRTVTDARGRLRTVAAFKDDMSRWEFSVLGTLYGSLQSALQTPRGLGERYSTGDQAWLLYQAALEVIPPRLKHNEFRNGRPFLLDRAAALVAERQATAAQARDQ